MEWIETVTNDSLLELMLFTQYGGDMACCGCLRRSVRFRRIKTRKSFQCPHCYFQIYPMRYTVFEKTRSSLITWAASLTLYSIGATAMEVHKEFGITYKCAWRIMHLIKKIYNKELSIEDNFKLMCNPVFI